MRIYFVRHGDPNYEDDCLTDLGHVQAEAVAERLANCGIERIFSSSCGRAMETAGHTAKKLGLDVTPCDFMREIDWSPSTEEELPDGGNAWSMAEYRVRAGKTLLDRDWPNVDLYTKSNLGKSLRVVSEGADKWLAELGYQREGEYYRMTRTDTYKTIAMFSHGGASSMLFSYLFNIPFPQICQGFSVDLTSVSIVDFWGSPEHPIMPNFRLFNDTRHLEKT